MTEIINDIYIVNRQKKYSELVKQLKIHIVTTETYKCHRI